MHSVATCRLLKDEVIMPAKVISRARQQLHTIIVKATHYGSHKGLQHQASQVVKVLNAWFGDTFPKLLVGGFEKKHTGDREGFAAELKHRLYSSVCSSWLCVLHAS